MKLKEHITILIGLICLSLFSACSSKPEIEGTWIGAYRIELPNHEISAFPLHVIFEFEDDSISIKTFDQPDQGALGSEDKFLMKLQDSLFIIEGDTIFIRTNIADSLVLFNRKKPKELTVFKKLPNTQKHLRPSLEGKAFAMIGNRMSDSIDFINDSSFLHIGEVYSTVNRLESWTIDSFGPYTFLITSWPLSPPYLIESDDSGRMVFKAFINKLLEFRMKELSVRLDTSLLLGNWVAPHIDLIPPSPPPFEYEGDTREYLEIKTDTISKNQYGRTLKTKWSLNTTHEFILFNGNKFLNERYWKIVSLDSSNLTIEIRNHTYPSAEEYKKLIHYSRVE